VSAFIKLLHPDGECSDAEFEEYLIYAIEGRRRVKEQLNKRKADDEFADIHLSYVSNAGESIEVHCPESKGIEATVNPRASGVHDEVMGSADNAMGSAQDGVPRSVPSETPGQLQEQHFTIRYGSTGFSYQSIFGSYLVGAKKLTVEDPYVRRDYQIRNFLQVCELAVQTGTIKNIELVTGFEHDYQREEAAKKLDELKESLADVGVELVYRFDPKFHDRELRTDTGWQIQIGRGLDIYQRPDSWMQIGSSNLDLRPCLETKVNIFSAK
jgi:ATP-dependent Lon protease